MRAFGEFRMQSLGVFLMTTIKLSSWHIGLWIVLTVVAAGLAQYSCIRYNDFAGTDKTPGHVAIISVAVLSGPVVGPIANPYAGSDFTKSAVKWTLLLLCGVLVSLCPFVFIKRPVSMVVSGLSWAGFVAMSVVWFVAAIVSLGIALS